MGAGPLTVGTAGHVDHGKTTLVRALTGRDTDRLAEERRRGLSIELGFAELDLGRRRCSLVDVPGHERFVRTMVAGASGIDMFLLVVAADDGPMPQTHEHLAVLGALGVERGVIALSKVDLVERDVRELAALECEELLPDAPLIAVSATCGAGLGALREALAALAATVEPERPAEEDEPVLHVDRAFSVDGHGTVVTGTLWSGRLERGQRVVALPSGRAARVRAIEVHDRALEVATARQRVALNLAKVGREEIRRGDAITVEGASLRATYRLDAELSAGAQAIAEQRRAQVHLGTRTAPARVVDLGGGAVQLRLESPLLARRGDRLVVRSIAPPDTLGGGVVTDPAPRRHGPGGRAPATRLQLHIASGPSSRSKEGARRTAVAEPGPLAQRVLAELRKDGPRPAGAVALAERTGAEARAVAAALEELVTAGEAVRVKRDVFYPAGTYAELGQAIVELARRNGSTSIAEVRDALGISRKYAQALLERLDADRQLRRDGDRHYPREVSLLR